MYSKLYAQTELYLMKKSGITKGFSVEQIHLKKHTHTPVNEKHFEKLKKT